MRRVYAFGSEWLGERRPTLPHFDESPQGAADRATYRTDAGTAWGDVYFQEVMLMVSHYHRECALGDETLWNRIAISSHVSRERMAEWVKRSGGAALHIVIDHANTDRENAVGMMPTLCKEVRRWYAFELRMETRMLSYSLLGMVGCNADLAILEKLRVGYDNDGGASSFNNIAAAVSFGSWAAPALTSLKIDGVVVAVPKACFSSLTALTLRRLPVIHVLGTARIMSELPSCTTLCVEFRNQGTNVTRLSTEGPITHFPYVNNLKIAYSGYDVDAGWDFLRFSVFPDVRSLAVSLDVVVEPVDACTVLRQCVPNRERLTHLWLQGSNTEIVRELATIYFNVQHLVVESLPLVEMLLGNARDQGVTLFFPQLQYLEFRKIPLRAATNLVAYRRQRGATLLSTRVQEWGNTCSALEQVDYFAWLQRTVPDVGRGSSGSGSAGWFGDEDFKVVV